MDDLPANRLRLLIVENDRVTARDLEATLRRRGFIVEGIAYSAEQAKDLVKEKAPDLVLLDIQLGEGDEGIELAQSIREKYDVPAVFITGYSEDALYEKARVARPAAFLRKPFTDAELSACLEAVVEKSLAEERLKLRLPGLEAVSDHLPQAVVASDVAGNVVYLNQSAEALTGWTKADACDSELTRVLPLEILENTGSAEENDDGEKPLKERKASLTTKTGGKREIEERSAPIKTADGEMIGLVTVIAPVGTKPNKAAALGDLPEKDDFAMKEGRMPPPPARSEALRKIASIANDPQFKKLIRPRKTAGSSPSLGADPPPLPSETPPPSDTSAVFSASSSPLIDEVGDPLMVISEDGAITYANSEAAAEFGKGEPLVGTRFWQHFGEDEDERYDTHFNKPLVTGRRHRFDFHDSSRGKWYEIRAYRTRGGVLTLFTDTTTTRLEAAEAVRQQRLEGLGLLARGFAHDFNNHLTTLTGNISLARENRPDDSELQDMLKEAQTAAARATGLVQQLMTFARGGRPIRERSRVTDLIRRVLTEHRIQHPEIRYQFQGAETDLVANVDPSQVTRLIENLVSNSAASMTNGGVLIMRCSKVTPEEVMTIRGSHTPADEDHLLIEVIDTGHGMSDADLECVFEPYFTTRKENNATGIGLTVCESIAKAHSGFIHLQSKEGKGTIATFCAPLGRGRDSSGDDPDAPLAYPNFDIPNLTAKPLVAKGEEPILVGTRILILEDDAPIRRLMAATLRRAGHEVVETKEGRETIEVYRESMENNSKFHLLICDLTIENGMGGVETMRQLVQMDPDILAIVSSGYSDAPAMSSPASFGFRGVLPKPYAPSELRAAVHRMLSAHHIIP